MKLNVKLVLMALSVLFLGLSGCGSSSSETTTSDKGSVALYLTDAPGDYKSVFITIKDVSVHFVSTEDENTSSDDNSTEESGWKIIASPNAKYDLLTLQNGVLAKLGITELAVGKYTQVRLILSEEVITDGDGSDDAPYANYVVYDDNTSQELTVGSAFNTGIKLNHNFEVESNTTTSLVMDFDADESIHSAGDKLMMNPVIRLLDTTGDVSSLDLNNTDD